jgi:type IV pilus assembly protein PilW
MSASQKTLRCPGRDRGFTLVELMVTVAIALFLLGGLVTIVQNVRGAYNNQQSLVQLQDEQRFALTVITDAVQAAGYFPDPTTHTTAALPAAGAFGAGWVFAGTHPGAPANDSVATDTLSTRFQSNPNSYGPVLCDGTDTSQAAAAIWNVQFSLVTAGPNANTLQCSVNGNAPVFLVGGVSGFAVYYGVKRDFTLNDYNVDTYENWNVLQATGTDWANISSVRIVITFLNPLAGQTANQPPTITVERVIEVMARGGLHT